MAIEQFNNLASSSLSGAITSGATSLVVVSAATFPTTGNFRILVDAEIMLVTAVAGTTFTVTRAQENTSATAHANGVPVTHSLTAGALTQTLADRVSASGKRYTAIDANTQILWTLDDAAAPYANTGNGGTLALSDGYNTTTPQMAGLLNYAVGYTGTSGSKTVDTSIGESTPLSVSVWVFLFVYPSNGEIADKKYQTGSTWTSPYVAWNITLSNSDGDWQVGVAFAGNRQFVNLTNPWRVPLYQWTLLSFTYDTTSGQIKAYINGQLAGATSIGGSPSIDYGSHGAYQIGAATTQSISGSNVLLDDLRIESTVRSQAYYQAMYRNALNLL